MADQVGEVAAMFDRLADGYDQSGVAYYGLIARGLVDRLAVRPGERVLDVGAGRGAATLALAEAVGETGSVDAVDVAPGMVRNLAADTAHLRQVRVLLGDATDPQPPTHAAWLPFDVVTASLVLFFLPDPLAALVRWRALTRPGGRLGVATFQPWSGAWRELDALAREHLRDPGPIAAQASVFDTDEGVERLLSEAGYDEVRTESVIHRVRFPDVDAWVRWSRSGTVMGGIWTRTDEADHPEILRRSREILERTRDAEGAMWLEVGARYTFGRRPHDLGATSSA